MNISSSVPQAFRVRVRTASGSDRIITFRGIVGIPSLPLRVLTRVLTHCLHAWARKSSTPPLTPLHPPQRRHITSAHDSNSTVLRFYPQCAVAFQTPRGADEGIAVQRDAHLPVKGK